MQMKCYQHSDMLTGSQCQKIKYAEIGYKNTQHQACDVW